MFILTRSPKKGRAMNAFKMKLYLIGLFLFSTIDAFPQQLLSELNPYLQKTRVGLVDEFFARFNGNEVHPDFPKTKPNSRKMNLMMLIDLSQFKSKESYEFKDASNMMDVAINKNIHLNYSDTTWTALAHCDGSLDGKNVKFDMYLTVQHRRKAMYKWVISKVDGDIFNITPQNLNDGIMLYPDDHETNFMSLRRMTSEQPYNVINFIGKGFDYDNMSVFNYLVYTKRLKINHVEELEFIFTQIPGYIFHIAYFNRQNYNTGWLISKFHKATEQEKKILLQSLHFENRQSQKVDNIQQSNDKDTSEVAHKNTVKVGASSSLEDMFNRRANERVMQVQDFSSLLNESVSDRAKSFYEKKLTRLFVPEAHITIIDKTPSVLSVSDFCKSLANKDIVCESIDSICVPMWSKTMDEISTEQDTVILKAYKYPFANGVISKDKGKKTGAKLCVIKYDTEDGAEWIPQLGDMTVTIKKKQ